MQCKVRTEGNKWIASVYKCDNYFMELECTKLLVLGRMLRSVETIVSTILFVSVWCRCFSAIPHIQHCKSGSYRRLPLS